MQTNSAVQLVAEEKIGLMDRLLLTAYRTGRGALASLGMDDSRAGRRIKGALNTVGAFLTRALLSSGKRSINVQGQQMLLRAAHRQQAKRRANLKVIQPGKNTQK